VFDLATGENPTVVGDEPGQTGQPLQISYVAHAPPMVRPSVDKAKRFWMASKNILSQKKLACALLSSLLIEEMVTKFMTQS
jgi:hypothetical protein